VGPWDVIGFGHHEKDEEEDKQSCRRKIIVIQIWSDKIKEWKSGGSMLS
jgi:hypothetical protein